PDGLVHLLQTEPARSDLERPYRYVDAGDHRELLVLQHGLDELTLAAAEIEDAFRAKAPESGDHARDALLVEAKRRFDAGFLCGMRDDLRVGVRCLLAQPRERLAGE